MLKPLSANLKKLSLLSLLVSSVALSGCSDDESGKISLGLFTTKDIKINSFVDPAISGVTCHVSHIEADLDFSDPSDMGIACRQTGDITAAMLATIDTSKSGEVIFNKSKSILFKSLKIRRIYDADSQSLLYVSYSTKEINGSYKHSLSTVPLWATKAWQAPMTPASQVN
ncbi:CreA family protein [Moritella sp.]|uniref:CreA family protein n=1 Tax=Moritella sp. TaxID=78556 RepID=UPI001D279C74|nr:CreA family protein [Moritella sp.]MCJ8351644.1 CreA family protein [Moritella sp.]NQZ41692.1 CreA family protein [Moritella sp.]